MKLHPSTKLAIGAAFLLAGVWIISYLHPLSVLTPAGPHSTLAITNAGGQFGLALFHDTSGPPAGVHVLNEPQPYLGLTWGRNQWPPGWSTLTHTYVNIPYQYFAALLALLAAAPPLCRRLRDCGRRMKPAPAA